jgi:mannose-6-phosphate isomerase-like protein (cupin superfamily)
MVTDEHRTTDPIHRVSMAFERDGDDLWVTTWLQDGGHLPEHFHPSLEEFWEVVDGTADVKVDGAWRTLRPQDGVVYVGRNVRHELKNTSGREAHLRARVTPPGGLEDFLTESAWAAREGLYNARNLPRSLRGALWVADFADRFKHETVMTSPPPALQRVLLPPLAKLARRRK